MFNISIKVERWKFNNEFGVYVSNLGHFKDKYKRNLPIKISRRGYCLVKTDCGIVLAHRLVMLTFRPIPNREMMTIDHLNHNKRDNSIQNLEWVTEEENCRRAQQDLLETDLMTEITELKRKNLDLMRQIEALTESSQDSQVLASNDVSRRVQNVLGNLNLKKDFGKIRCHDPINASIALSPQTFCSIADAVVAIGKVNPQVIRKKENIIKAIKRIYSSIESGTPAYGLYWNAI